MLVTASPASAHARLEASSPKDGSTLTATPPEIMLRFNEPVKDGLNQVSVTSGSTDATQGKVEVDGNNVYQPLKSSLKSGAYKVTYKVVSADGHPISGTLSFTYAPPNGDTGAGAPSSTPSSSPTSSDSPSSSAAPSTAPSSSSTSSAPAPSSSSAAEPSTSSSTSQPSSSSSSSTSPSDGETAPSQPSGTSSSSDAAGTETNDDTSAGSDGVPTWVWIGGIGAALMVLAGIGLALRGRRDEGDDEEINLEEWRG